MENLRHKISDAAYLPNPLKVSCISNLLFYEAKD